MRSLNRFLRMFPAKTGSWVSAVTKFCSVLRTCRQRCGSTWLVQIGRRRPSGRPASAATSRFSSRRSCSHLLQWLSRPRIGVLLRIGIIPQFGAQLFHHGWACRLRNAAFHDFVHRGRQQPSPHVVRHRQQCAEHILPRFAQPRLHHADEGAPSLLLGDFAARMVRSTPAAALSSAVLLMLADGGHGFS